MEVDPTYAAKVQNKGKEKVEEFEDLSSDDIGRLKRKIANLLEPGETVCFCCIISIFLCSPFLSFTLQQFIAFSSCVNFTDLLLLCLGLASE